MDLEYHRVGDYVEARASGTAKEIASLVLELQGRPKKVISVSTPKAQTPEERGRFARGIEEVLRAQSQAHSSKQQPDPTLPERNEDAELHPEQPAP